MMDTKYMARAFVLTIKQASALESLHNYKVMTAGYFDRDALEQLVNKGLAIKHQNGRGVTYGITGSGETIYKSL